MSAVRFRRRLWLLLLVASLLRLVYVLTQPGHDPWFDRPTADGAYYVGWAKGLLGGPDGWTEPLGGAFYLAPLYSHLLAALFSVTGSFTVLYLLQQLLSVGSAALLAVGGRRRIGEPAALAAAGLMLFYHPLLFLASRPLGETVALFLLVASIVTLWRGGAGAAFASGALAGAACLARPNLLLVVALWALVELASRRFGRATLLVLGAALLVLPVTLRNVAVSGHAVPISSNGGMTLYHGNGPQARGVFQFPEGFSGALRNQREEATRLASRATGEALDAVTADRYWGARAVEARLDDPAGSAALAGRRLLLTLQSRELGLGYAPDLDPAFWRIVHGVPFAFLLACAAGAVASRGFRASGGTVAWSALLACAVTPLAFYVSSRYRLPLAAVACIPAGCGLADLLTGASPRRTVRLAATIVGVLALSLLAGAVVYRPLDRPLRAQALADRSLAWRSAGDLAAAERDARQATDLHPATGKGWYALGVVLEASGSEAEAERGYRRAAGPSAAPSVAAQATANLAAMLTRRGVSAEAIPLLRSALARQPLHEYCWNNLIVALLDTQRLDEAALAVDEAASFGVPVWPDVAAAVDRARRP